MEEIAQPDGWTAEELEAHIEHYAKILLFRPYSWQKEFYDMGAHHKKRMIMAANRVGKTYSAAFEVACHLTGEYPDWWQGVRFDHPIECWTGSVTNEAARDIVQANLIGGIDEKMGTGLIPLSCIKKVTMRQAGVSGVADAAQILHVSGGTSAVTFKTYDQGWRKWQGKSLDLIWLDEEPKATDKNEAMIWTEAQTRVLDKNGTILVTFTPLLGKTQLVRDFLENKPGTWYKNVTWDDAPHLDQAAKANLAAAYPDYELEARTKGTPMLGSGRVFPFSEDMIRVDPYALPSHAWHIMGIDFGIDHFAATAWVAYEPDGDVITVYDVHKQKNRDSLHHTDASKRHGDWIPVAWPHDGGNRDKGSGKQLKEFYEEKGLKMLPKSAHYAPRYGENPRLGAQPTEPIIQDIYERIPTGRFKVFSHCTEFFEEFRSYHREDGKIVSRDDDVLKAVFYAVMMKRFAMPRVIHKTQVNSGMGLSVAI